MDVSVGDRFGKWTVIDGPIRKMSNYGIRLHYKVQCDCGETGEHAKSNLLSGGTKQCRKCRYAQTTYDRNYKYLGTDASYGAKHSRVRTAKGTATYCVFGCKAKSYHWANVLGTYDDIESYVSMCAKCHKRFDNEVIRMLRATSTDPLVREHTAFALSNQERLVRYRER